MKRQPVAFMSYSSYDDDYEQGALTRFCERLAAEIHLQTGREFPIFQDRKDIEWGQNWRERIKMSLDEVTFFIPFITPNFFQSTFCCDELRQFLHREGRLERDDLILPVYYVSCELLDDATERATNDLARAMHTRQWIDWRDLRFVPMESAQVKMAFARLAGQVAKSLQRTKLAKLERASENNLASQPVGASRKITVIIDMEKEHFDETDQRLMQYALAQFLNVSPTSIKTTSIEEGSVKVTIELPEHSAEQLLDAYQRRDPLLFDSLWPMIVLKVHQTESTTPPEVADTAIKARMIVPENIGRLINIIKRGASDPAHGAFLWVGAGLSIPAGYPSWTALVERLREASVEPLADESDPLAAIDAFIRVNGTGLLSQQMQELFGHKPPRTYHMELMQLPWKGIVTTNYDELLEDALKQVEKSYVKVTLEQNLDLVTGHQLLLLKVHGDMASFRDVILSGESYHAFHDRHPLLKADLESYLRKYSLVFFGCSMTDPRLLAWLRDMPAASRQHLLPSCAVLTEGAWDRLPAEDRAVLESGNIRPILVQAHDDIPELIRYVLNDIPPPVPPTEAWGFEIAFTSADHDQWRITSHHEERIVDVPWRGSNAFGLSLRAFVALTQESVHDEQRTELHTHATRLGDALGQALMSAAAWQRIRDAHTRNGPQPVTIASDDDLILSLPWELLRVDGDFVVREGTIDLLRTTSPSAPNPPTLTAPDHYLKLVVNVSAPQGSGQLNYEAESYRLVRALHAHSAVVFTELGTVEDMVDAVVQQNPTGVHFSGHGEPGALVFEDDEGRGEAIAIEDVLRKIRQQDGHLPRFFYLASCHGNTAPNPEANRPGTTLSSAHLHRQGVVQVVGYYGPMVDALSTVAEEAFYRALAAGRTTRAALRRARLALVDGHEVDGATYHKAAAEAVAVQVSQHPFAWAQLVLYHRGPDHPLSKALPAHYAQAQEAQLKRSFTGTEQRQILSTGFIGRRQELHQVRRLVRQGQRVLVFQGLGGLGKSTLAFKALPMLSRDGQYPSLTIWCQELEQQENLARALTEQLSALAQTLFGDGWANVVQAVDRMPEATEPQRFGFFLQAMLQNIPHLVLYLDNLESLLRGPDNEDPEAFGAWRSADLQAIWSILQSHRGDHLSVVASCRYRHASFEADTIPLADMHDAAIFRMMGWFDGLRQLSLPNRAELVRRLHGHPRAVALLDALIRDALTRWQSRHGEWVAPRTQAAIQDEWQQLVAPALPDVDAQLRANLLFDAIWHQVLDKRCHRMLFRMTLLRRPWDWALMMQLGDADDGEDQVAATAEKLRATSLLGEVQERREDRWVRRFQVHPTTTRFVTERMASSEINVLTQTTYLRVGSYLEEVAKTLTDLNDYLDAGHYLFAGSEFDRAYALLGSASTWLQERGMVRMGLTILEPFEAVAKQMVPEREGRLLGTLGAAYFRLGQYKQSIAYHEQALTISREIGDRRGEGSDLGNLGLAYQALGELGKAKAAWEEALTKFLPGTPAYQQTENLLQAVAPDDESA